MYLIVSPESVKSTIHLKNFEYFFIHLFFTDALFEMSIFIYLITWDGDNKHRKSIMKVE